MRLSESFAYDLGGDSFAGPTGSPGKRTLTASLQCRADRVAAEPQPAAAPVPYAAVDPFWFATGPAIADAGSELPHQQAIQRSFGRHDVSGISAHVGGAAADGAAGLGAVAYATGSHVAFATSPDLHTAAHEAAHVVQQRAGVQLKGGLGQVGDEYERHADAVADAVVRGESAESLLDQHGGGSAASGVVQRKYKPDAEVPVEQRNEPRFDDFFGGYIKVLGPEQGGRQLVEEIATGKHWIFIRDENRFESVFAPRRDDDEEDLSEDETSDDDEDDDDAPFELFHGTDLKTALKLAKTSCRISALGKGEFGGGFYMCHDVHQAAHIADVYCSTEKRGTHWAVVKFTVSRDQLRALVGNRKEVSGKEFSSYHEQVRQSGNAKESKYAWTIGPIKDRTTPYMQHLFAQEGLDALNHESTTREVVLQGQIGIDKGKYNEGNTGKGYDPDNDDVLDELVGLEPLEDEDDDDHKGEGEDDDDDYNDLAGQVKEALQKNAPKLTAAVRKRVQSAYDETEDERYLALLKQLG